MSYDVVGLLDRGGSAVLEQAVDGTGRRVATASVDEPSCFGSDSEDLTVAVTEVTATGASAASDLALARDGGW